MHLVAENLQHARILLVMNKLPRAPACISGASPDAASTPRYRPEIDKTCTDLSDASLGTRSVLTMPFIRCQNQTILLMISMQQKTSNYSYEGSGSYGVVLGRLVRLSSVATPLIDSRWRRTQRIATLLNSDQK